MADILPFEARLGSTTGAIPIDVVAAGDAALVVGDTSRSAVLVADGDYHDVYRQITVPPLVRFVRMALSMACLRPAASAASWTCSITRAGLPRVPLPVWRNNHTRQLSRAAIPVNPIGETLELGFRIAFSLAGGGEAIERVPALIVDAVVEDAATIPPQYVLINYNPEPGEVGVPLDSHVVIEIHDVAWGNIVDATDFTVLIDGVIAWDRVTDFAPDFFGPDSVAELVDDGTTWRITIDKTSDFLSQSIVNVTVSYTPTADPSQAVFATYDFETEDKTLPKLLRADTLGHKTIRATFDEAMAVELATDPAHWTINLVSASLDDGLPALGVGVLSAVVVPTDPTSFDIELDDEMTTGARYLLRASGVKDLSDNLVDPEYDTVIVVGYACPAPSLRRFDLMKWIPEHNVAADHPRNGGGREIEALVRVWQHLFDRALCGIDNFTEIFDPDRAPEPFIDAMLADFGVSIYGPRRTPLAFFGLEGLEKRRLLRAIVPLYKKKGTPDGIAEAVLIFLALTVTIRVPALEGVWVLDYSRLDVDTKLATSDPGPAYSFYVVSPIALTEDQRVWIERFADYAKPAHVHFLGIIEP